MIIQFIIFLIDTLLINVVFLIAFYLRYGLPLPEHNFQPYQNNFAFLTFAYMLAFSILRVFKKRFVCHWDVCKRITAGMFLGTMFGFMLVYVFRMKWATFPSSIFAISFPIGVFLISTVNIAILRLANRIKKRVIVIGKEKINDITGDDKLVDKISIEKIEDILKHPDIDEIILCEKIHEDSQLNLLLFLLLKSKVKVAFSPSLYADILSGNITEVNSVDFLATFLGRKSEWEEFLIRMVDVTSAFCVLVITLPVMLLTALLVKLTSPGPICYVQERSGKDGIVFKLVKFRTMVNDAEKKSGPVWATSEDNRITPLGKFLRQTRIDELPQVLNVLKGHMSMVGPRPERPHFAKLHKALRGIRMAVKPGLTGLAQIRSSYDIKPQHKIKYDYLYIQRRSVMLNIYLMFKTISVMILRKGL
jgi:lipopolysaccharide/colanic/teichoic acid biosynthesis glycosyltransferase